MNLVYSGPPEHMEPWSHGSTIFWDLACHFQNCKLEVCTTSGLKVTGVSLAPPFSKPFRRACNNRLLMVFPQIKKILCFSAKAHPANGTCSDGSSTNEQSQSHHELTTAVSGFPKSKNGQYNIENILKGQIGDDAYFITRHVDDWNNNSGNETRECADKLLNPSNITGRVFQYYSPFLT